MFNKISVFLALTAILTVLSCGKSSDNPLAMLLLGGSGGDGELVTPETGVSEGTDTAAGSDAATDEGTTEGVTVAVNDVEQVIDESQPFDLSTTKSVNVDLTVNDQNGPLSPALVRITDTSGGSEEVLFQAATGETGKTTGEFTIPDVLDSVKLEIIVGDTVLYSSVVNVSNLAGIIRVVTSNSAVDTSSITDSDEDSVPDTKDEFPSDPTRSARILDFEDGQGTMAFEDQYPGKGDADFNDYVVSVKSSHDVNAQGKVAAINARYQHVAKGAAFNHLFYLNVPGNLSATVTVKVYDPDGVLKDENSYTSTANIPVLPDSSTTIAGQNVTNDDSFVPGYYADVSIVFASPADVSVIGSAPYDPYIYVQKNKKEVHFPGKVFKHGKDLYLNSGDGFPWAIMVPRQWNWPMESRHIDDRGSSNGCYPDFDNWYESHGTQYRDWYANYDANCVYPYIESSSGLLAFLKGSPGNEAVIILTVLIGAVGLGTILLMKKKRA